MCSMSTLFLPEFYVGTFLSQQGDVLLKIPKATKLPSGMWRIQLRLNGTSISITEPTEKACIKQAELTKAEYNAGKKFEASSPLTLSQAIDKYIEDKRNVLSPATIKGYRSIQTCRFQNVMYKKAAEIKNWQKVVNEESYLCSAKTLDNAYGFIKSVLKYNGIEAVDVKLPQIVPNEREWLEPEQIPIFLNAIKGHPCEIGALLALHSFRRSEIFALTKKNFNFNKKYITTGGAVVLDENNKFVHKKEQKTVKSGRVVPIMIPRLEALVKALPDDDAKLVKCYPDTLRKWINKFCEKSELPKVGTHGLRHSFASLAYSLKWTEQETMRIGGWDDPTVMRKIYTHLAERDKERAENSMSDFYKALEEPEKSDDRTVYEVNLMSL